MSHSTIPEYPETIDEVVQSSQASMPIEYPGDSAISFNSTQPLSPILSRSSSSRGDNTGATRRPSQTSQQDHYGVSVNGRLDKDTANNSRNSRQSDGSVSSKGGHTTTLSRSVTSMSNGSIVTDFFGPDVFRIVLQNPTTAHRLQRFCQSRACGENMEFLQKVHSYNRLLDDLTQLLGTIHHTYISPDAPKQLNLPHSHSKRVSSDIRQITQFTIPSLEAIFSSSQGHIEKLIAGDIYSRFVKHQITTSATMALANHRERFQGLGDCFCLTDPRVADNPIVYVSDGFVSVTGYTRKDIIPRNCRFLQGEQTDPLATKRLKESIHSCEETVELLLNYRKNGDPFWNLLYVSPLFNERGEITFFLGGQINCSTTIHSCTDVLKVLSVNDDELDRMDKLASKNKPSSLKSRDNSSVKTRNSFFKSFRKYNGSEPGRRVIIRDEAGMEAELLNRVGKLSFKTQVEAFYTAYSKYLVMDYNSILQTLLIQHYSPGVIDMLCLNLPNGGIVPIYNKDIFKVLSDHASSSSSSSISRTFKQTVRDALARGRAVSVEAGLLTGFAERKGGGWFCGDRERLMRVEEGYVTHWTPLKDEEGRVRWVVLTIVPKD
ncbi:hypothetical protein G7Y89_g6263 [Cudoniella acicularis]|uniref:RGS domain-containing protein n=1 Tax=Cudoniella acicularis TaxID=354080 RepID=A0A8H4RN32_9HELO|nr:hypothetical protein G7Y89_g6263 [Cudoniella acicularis]